MVRMVHQQGAMGAPFCAMDAADLFHGECGKNRWCRGIPWYSPHFRKPPFIRSRYAATSMGTLTAFSERVTNKRWWRWCEPWGRWYPQFPYQAPNSATDSHWSSTNCGFWRWFFYNCWVFWWICRTTKQLIMTGFVRATFSSDWLQGTCTNSNLPRIPRKAPWTCHTQMRTMVLEYLPT